MRVRFGVVAIVLTGCTTWSPFAPARLLAQGDALIDRGQYSDAITAYDEVLLRYPDSDAAVSAAARRDVVASLVAAREQLATLGRDLTERQTEVQRLLRDLAEREAEVTRVSRDLAAREAEVAWLRHELMTRQAEVARLALEMETLRSDLQRLKRLEMRLERRRP